MGKYDVGEGASGAFSGASTGFAAGGPVGGVVGFVAGASKGLFGKKKRKKSHLEKRQKQLNKDQYSAFHGEGPLADLYNYDPEKSNEVFDKTIGRKAYRDLNEKAIPAVTGQFRNEGLMKSSYAADAIAKLTRDVQESLDAQRTETLYKEQKEARDAKRQGIENYQKREAPTKANKQGGGGGGLGGVSNFLTPENVNSAWDAVGDFAVNKLPGGV
jgi:hypothetical protein